MMKHSEFLVSNKLKKEKTVRKGFPFWELHNVIAG